MPPKRKSSHLSTGDTPAPSDELSVGSSSATNTPIKPTAAVPKTKKVKVEKEKAKAASKGKAVSAATSAKDKDKDKDKGKEGAADKKTLDKNGKEKIKAVTGDEATEVILEYLRRENRPFSAGDVSGNLHGKVCFLFIFLHSPLNWASLFRFRTRDLLGRE
ncbi:tbp1-interacting tbpip protein [Rutstroemia sp. NJR-2017a BVV2]|nr:tbp1-interacting tbpip protein [Rutstroemia sp. NJR-2017a BVV2]